MSNEEKKKEFFRIQKRQVFLQYISPQFSWYHRETGVILRGKISEKETVISFISSPEFELQLYYNLLDLME